MYSAFSKNIKALRNSKDMTQEQLANALDMSTLTVGNWERDGKIPRKHETIEKICAFFGVTENDLFSYNDGFCAKSTGIKNIPGSPLVGSSEAAYLPYLGYAHAGKFDDPATIEGAVVEVPKSVADRHPEGRVIKVDGECVNKVISNGSIAVVDPTVEPRRGSIVCVSLDGQDFILRRMYKGANVLMLSPDSYSDEFEDIIFDDPEAHEIDLIGTVVWYQAQKEME